MLGLARAESAMGDGGCSEKSYTELIEIWKNADPGYAPKEEAQRYISSARARLALRTKEKMASCAKAATLYF